MDINEIFNKNSKGGSKDIFSLQCKASDTNDGYQFSGIIHADYMDSSLAAHIMYTILSKISPKENREEIINKMFDLLDEEDEKECNCHKLKIKKDGVKNFLEFLDKIIGLGDE